MKHPVTLLVIHPQMHVKVLQQGIFTTELVTA